MRFYILAILCLISTSLAFDDFLTEASGSTNFEERAVISAVSNLASAAKSFAGSLGSTARLASPVSKSFEDSCLGQNAGIRLPTNININTIKKIFGKREEKLANRDIVFVLDTSGSIPQDQFDKAKKAITTLVESFCPTKFGNAVTEAGSKQISVVLFGTKQTIEVDFSESAKGLGYLQDKILDMKHRKGGTATGDALKFVREKVLGKGSSRLSNSRVSTDVIIITDGQCNRNCRILGSEAQKIRDMGVNIFAMGVANARACELEIITGKGSTLAYGLGDFRNFDRFAQAVKEIAQENDSKCA